MNMNYASLVFQKKRRYAGKNSLCPCVFPTGTFAQEVEALPEEISLPESLHDPVVVPEIEEIPLEPEISPETPTESEPVAEEPTEEPIVEPMEETEISLLYIWHLESVCPFPDPASRYTLDH